MASRMRTNGKGKASRSSLTPPEPTPIETATIVLEVPKVLADSLDDYLSQHPERDANWVGTCALALFLLQNGDCDRRAARVFLDTYFSR